MSTRLAVVCAAIGWSGMQAQPALPPVIDQRGVVNAFTQVPAPSLVAPGGIIWIKGLNLGPPAGAVASGIPLPVELGEPPVRVLINNRPAPLISADLSRIVAQVPVETAVGLANVVVRRNGADSRPARINIVNILPSVRTADESGFGELKGTKAGNQYSFTASGLGVTDPRIATGEAGPADNPARPRAEFNVHVGGILVDSDIRASSTNPGEFDITVTLPDKALPGDMVTLSGNGRLANLATYQLSNQVDVTFVPLPAGAPDLRAMTGSDLRGGYFIASAARADNGCWPSVLFDIREKTASTLSACLTAPNRNAQSPVVASNDGASLAAFVGPPQGDGTPGQPVSNKVMIYSPSVRPLPVDLPMVATQLVGLDATNFAAITQGTPPQVSQINALTGEVTPGLGGINVGGGGGGAGGGGGGGAGAGIALNVLNLRVDLGGGIDKLLTMPVALAPGQNVVAVGDDANNPTKAKLAVLNNQGDVTATRDFPDGWLPMVMPPAPAVAGGVGPGVVGPGGQQITVNPFRVGVFTDPQTRTLYMGSKKADDSGTGVVAIDGNNVIAIGTPANVFIAGCTNVAQIFSIETSRKLLFYGTSRLTREFNRVCNANSFLSLDLTTQNFTTIELPGNGLVNATDRGDDINDFVLAASTGGETLFAIDGVTLTSYRFDLPQGVVAFANLVAYPQLGLAVGTGRARNPGDAGFLVFDLERVETRQLLLPDAFGNVQLLGVLTGSRKLVARGVKTGGTSSQFLIYDMQTGEVTLVDNPPNVAFVAQVPAAQPGGGQQPPGQGGGQAAAVPPMQRLNVKANTIEAVTFGADRRANGAMLIRVP